MDEVLVVGASVGGSTAAETLRRAGVPVILLERDLERVKPCGGAVPPILIKEFEIPDELIVARIRSAHQVSALLVALSGQPGQFGRGPLPQWTRERSACSPRPHWITCAC